MPWRGGRNPANEVPLLIREMIRKKALAAMTVVIVEAVNNARQFTETRPSPNSGKEGRVDTGLMLESIMGETFFEGVDKIVGRFGFINRQELYFLLQTVTGFNHGDFIEPTFAIRDAAVIALGNLIEEMKK